MIPCAVPVVLVVQENNMRFNSIADAYLEKLYASVGAVTDEQKYNTLMLKMGINDSNISFSHDPTWEQKKAMLEYDLLANENLIEQIYA